MKNALNPRILCALLILAAGCAGSPDSKRSLSKAERIEALMTIAAAAVAENDSISALETLNRIRELDDSIPREHLLYALAYLNKNELALAEESARRALKLDPGFSAAKNALGKILMERGKAAEAEPYLLEAASDLLYRDSALPKTNLGILYFKRMDYEKAAIWLTRAVSDGGPFSCYAQYYLGKVNLERQDLRSAARNLQGSLKGTCSGLSEVHLTLGQTLIRQKRFDQARAKMIEIQRLFPDTDASDEAAKSLRGIP
jgi:type IV pilus assembly protein PilF